MWVVFGIGHLQSGGLRLEWERLGWKGGILMGTMRIRVEESTQ